LEIFEAENGFGAGTWDESAILLTKPDFCGTISDV
jgi:hypothetical protein